MKHVSTTHVVATATLQDVMDCIAANPGIAASRKRDLRSAVISLGKLAERPPESIQLDLGALRAILDRSEGSRTHMSAKRRANLRSDLTAAIDASGLHPVLKTGALALDPAWKALLDPIPDRRIQHGLSRFARWCTLHGLPPGAVDEAVISRFADDLGARTLMRNVEHQRLSVISAWNRLAAVRPDISAISSPASARVLKRIPWKNLPDPLLQDLQRYMAWCTVPDPLDDNARATRLAPATVRLRRDQVHSAVTAAVAAGVPSEKLHTLAALVEVEIFKAILGKLYRDDGNVLTPYTHGVAGTLTAIAKEWVGAPPETVGALKKLRRKLGALPTGLTDKNKSFLRSLDDTRLFNSLINLPDELWRRARRGLGSSKRPFIDLQTALALDILLTVPLRMKNVASLSFKQHLHWPNGRGKPAMLVIAESETKNHAPIEFELPTELAECLWMYRHEIAPKVTGNRPDVLFVATTGKPRKQGAVTLAIEKAVRKHVGVKLTPHQFRHLAAKIILDANPGAHELVRQLLVHKNLKTTTNYYAGINTLRAGRAHADLLVRLKNDLSAPKTKRRKA